MNMPRYEVGDPIYDALKRRGLRRPKHSTKIASNIANDADYDQLMFFAKLARQSATGKMGVFDFDGAIFAKLWAEKTQAQFSSFTKYHISDHRPHWAEFSI